VTGDKGLGTGDWDVHLSNLCPEKEPVYTDLKEHRLVVHALGAPRWMKKSLNLCQSVESVVYFQGRLEKIRVPFHDSTAKSFFTAKNTKITKK
jgi:hypothetical protein